MVRAFINQNSLVFFCDVDAKAGAALAKQFPHSAFFARADLTRETEILRWIKQIRKSQPNIRALINNAARDPRIPLESTSAKNWDALFATNLRAYFLLAREVAPQMNAGASIINFSSITFHTAPAAMS